MFLIYNLTKAKLKYENAINDMKELIITWQGLLFEAVTFLIFTYLLNLFLFKPIRAILKKRQENIDAHNEKQKYFEESAAKLNEDVRKEKLDLKIEINKIKETYRKEAMIKTAKIISSAKKDASSKFSRIVEDFDKEKTSIINYYKSKSEELADLIYKKILE